MADDLPPDAREPSRRRLLGVLGAFVVTSPCAGARSMKTDLSAEETRQLADIRQFNASRGKGWKLNGRTVRSASWSGIELSANASIEDVDLDIVDLTQARFTDTAFVGVDFRACDLSGAVFERCRLERCKLGRVKLRQAQFRECTLVDTACVELDANATVFAACRFQHCRDESGLFKDARFSSCGFADCAFQLTSCTSCKLTEVAFVGGRLDNLRFSHLDAKRLHFRQVELKAVACDGGAAAGLVVERCESRQLSFNGMRLSGLRVLQSPVAEGLAMADCELDDALLEGNPLFEPSFYRSRLGNLRVDGGRLRAFSMEECRLSPGSTFKAVTLQGANFGDSTLDGTLFDGCTFEKYLVLTGTTLRGVRLPQARYGSGFEVNAAGVVYVGGERFPKS
jgi:uncharacterized protein YjbI with pentapeptide repeats